MKAESGFREAHTVRVNPSGDTRRRFIKTFVLGTAFSTIGGRDWLATVVGACDPVASGAGILRVKISDFPVLQNANGSVRLVLNPFTQNGPSGFFYPILINRGSGNDFFALNTQCTHAGCVVPTFNAGSSASICPCHGSRYAIDGTILVAVIGGQRALTQYPVTFDGSDLLCVEVPNLGYSITGMALETTAGSRFRLQFPTRRGVRYEVRFRQNLGDAGTVVPFSTTETGPVTSTSITGVVTPATATIFVERAAITGFYSVAVIVTSS